MESALSFCMQRGEAGRLHHVVDTLRCDCENDVVLAQHVSHLFGVGRSESSSEVLMS